MFNTPKISPASYKNQIFSHTQKFQHKLICECPLNIKYFKILPQDKAYTMLFQVCYRAMNLIPTVGCCYNKFYEYMNGNYSMFQKVLRICRFYLKMQTPLSSQKEETNQFSSTHSISFTRSISFISKSNQKIRKNKTT